MSLNRREMLRLGAYGAGRGDSLVRRQLKFLPSLSAAAAAARARSAGAASDAAARSPTPAPGGIDPQLFARAKAALDRTRSGRATRSASSTSRSRRASRASTSSTCRAARSKATASPMAAARTPTIRVSSSASRTTSAPTRRRTAPTSTGDYYDGKYGLSMKVRGLDWSNNNAEAARIVIHNAWYAEDDMIPLHGKLGRSEGCFAMEPQEPVRGDAQARRRPHDLRRQARVTSAIRDLVPDAGLSALS